MKIKTRLVQKCLTNTGTSELVLRFPADPVDTSIHFNYIVSVKRSHILYIFVQCVSDQLVLTVKLPLFLSVDIEIPFWITMRHTDKLLTF